MLREIVDKYETFFIDAYGVLVDVKGALPFAQDFLNFLEQSGKEFFILTNGSSLRPDQTAQSYLRRGIKVDEARIISSGMIARHWLKEASLQDKGFVVLGPSSSYYIVEEACAHVLPITAQDADGIIITDQSGYDMVEAVDNAVNIVKRRRSQGKETILLLANPDILYPASDGAVGFTSGLVAFMIERCLQVLYGVDAPSFVRLGKPCAPIYDYAKNVAKGQKMLMIGDQIDTDVVGARNAGMDSLLLGSGICQTSNLSPKQRALPTYICEDLRL